MIDRDGTCILARLGQPPRLDVGAIEAAGEGRAGLVARGWRGKNDRNREGTMMVLGG